MNKTLKRETFELRFFPMAAFFDRRSGLLDLLYRDSRTKKNNFQHWQLDQNRVALFDADGSRTFSCSFQNCAFSCVDPPTDNYSHDQILKYFGATADYFGDKIENVLRAGFRRIQVVPVKDFDELTKKLVDAFVKVENPLFQALGSSLNDLKLFPFVFKHGGNKYQITLGPTTREELKTLWGDDPELPERAMYVDVDYYAVQPAIHTDLTKYVAEFLAKAKEIDNRIFPQLTEMATGI
jgi:hypothetical protein